MDVRKVQKTGNMHYVYLPTHWCKKHKITSVSNVSLEEGSRGELSIFPDIKEHLNKDLVLHVKEDNLDTIAKLIVACYINPANSFKIKLDTDIDLNKLLLQKRVFAVEFVELDNKTIFCESGLSVSDPESLLKTLSRRIKSLVHVMVSDYDESLIEKYEEEIDKGKVLLEKVVISSLASNRILKVKAIDLHYISLIAYNLENLVDNLIQLKKTETAFLKSLVLVVDSLNQVIEKLTTVHGIGEEEAIAFINQVNSLKEIEVTNVSAYYKKRIRDCLMNVSEVLIDWAITNKLEAD
ncbi:MAG: hypothetical protein Q7S92_03075 [Candidatus Diapherotrites archaeon]|nr:hypothetical protein [Candidatus Diapherotrites archaeon]